MMARPLAQVGRYQLFEAIASGGMASVHLGRLQGPIGFSRTVAIKRLHPYLVDDHNFVAMLVDEAMLAARVRHPNVVATIDVVSEAGELFLVMEYVAGESLSQLFRASIDAGQRIPVRVASAIVLGALYGLDAAHEATDEHGRALEIVHRDVSPQNILVGIDGIPRVVDFGIAKASSRLQTTKNGEMKGKLAYMAPEQLRRAAVDRRADVWAAGVVLWELLAGTRLFQSDDPSGMVEAILSRKIPRVRDHCEVSPQLDDVVERALARDPSLRYARAIDFAAGLEAAVTPAPQREVASWVRALAAERLAERTRLVAEVERVPVSPEPKLERVPALLALAERKAMAEAATSTFVGPTTTTTSAEDGLEGTVEPTPAAPFQSRTLVSLALLVLVVGVAALGLIVRSSSEPGGSIASATSSPASSVGAPASASEAPPSRPSATSEQPSGSAPDTPSSTTPDTSSSRSSTTSPPRLRAGPHPTATARSAPRASSCDPSFFIDSSGVKRFKPECL